MLCFSWVRTSTRFALYHTCCIETDIVNLAHWTLACGSEQFFRICSLGFVVLINTHRFEITLRSKPCSSGWWFRRFFYFHPYLGKIPNLTYIFQRGWNHQQVISQKLFLTFFKQINPWWFRTWHSPWKVSFFWRGEVQGNFYVPPTREKSAIYFKPWLSSGTINGTVVFTYFFP